MMTRAVVHTEVTGFGAARRLVPLVAALGFGIVALVLLLLGVDVDAGLGTATCGSAFDSISGRTGWVDWWARDLADPSAGDSLPRTEGCPDAVNRRMVLAGTSLFAAGMAGLVFWRYRPRRTRNPASDRRIGRLATGITAVGGFLTLGGVVAVILLVADPDSTLFLYVGRGVVLLIGLIALVPAIGLAAAGVALRLVAEHVQSTGDESDESDEP